MSVEKLENKLGSLAGGYRETLRSVDILMSALDGLEAAGHLPKDAKLDNAFRGIYVALTLGKMHFPSLELKGCRELPQDPCPMCSRSLDVSSHIPTRGTPDSIRTAIANAIAESNELRPRAPMLADSVYNHVRDFLAQHFTVVLFRDRIDRDAVSTLFERITK